MPVRRTPDGKIVEEKTQIQRSGSAKSEGPTTLDPDSVTDRGNQPTGSSRFNAETKVVPRGGAGTAPVAPLGQAPVAPNDSAGQPQAPVAESGNRTRLVGFGKTGDSAAADSPEVPATGGDQPVTGWLVVVKGPGRGNFAPIGLGRNSVGRSPQARVALCFGDDTISRDSHIVISYDHRGRQFFLQPGEGQNLSYLNDAPIMGPVPLEDGALIALGETEAKFVAFCGSEFDWSDSE